LTQRILGFPSNQNLSYGTIKMHIKNMAEGDVAGLCVFQDPYAYIGVKVINGKKNIILLNSGTKTQQVGAAIADSVVYLRAVANYLTSQADFYYSTDNLTFTKSGSLNMQYSLNVFVGNRFGIFNYATTATGGYVDVDWFSTENDFSENTFFDNSFKGYSEDALTLSGLKTATTNIALLTGSSQSIAITALYKDGHSDDVTMSATYTNSNPNVVTIKNGLLIANTNGDATLTVTYQGGMGDAMSLTLNIHSTYFPLTGGLFNPSICSAGTFNETTATLVTGQYGFGGWSYSSGIDLSNYKYLVAKLGKVSSSGASFRAFDENSYWSNPVLVDFGSKTQAVINLSKSVKSGTTTKFDPSHIYIVGIWSSGGSPIVINNIYVTNNDDYSKPSLTDPVVSVNLNPLASGKVTGGGSYSIGSTCTLIATPANGYNFANWTSGGKEVSFNDSCTFKVSESCTLVANFVPNDSTFKVKETNCTCSNSNDGAINITFAHPDAYTIAVTSGSFSKTGTGSTSYSLTELAAGTYNVSISIAGLIGYQQVFTVIISQPKDLSVMKVKTANNTTQYLMSGGENYYITVNNETTVTQSNAVDIPLQNGENSISIRTDKMCQGTYEETIYFDGSGQIALFPNPTDGPIAIDIPGKDKTVNVEITSVNGSVKYKQIISIQPDRLVHINISCFPAGIYFVKINAQTVNSTLKIMKK